MSDLTEDQTQIQTISPTGQVPWPICPLEFILSAQHPQPRDLLHLPLLGWMLRARSYSIPTSSTIHARRDGFHWTW